MVPLPVNLAMLIVISLWLAYEIDKNTKRDKKIIDDFLKRERESFTTRKADISHLPKVTLPDNFPYVQTSDKHLQNVQNQIKQLSTADIINLNEMSNTDIRITYGVANFKYLSECDSNYSKLCMLLNKFEKLLNENKLNDERKAVLEYAVAINSDTCSIYSSLMDMYLAENNTDKISSLIESAKTIKTSTRKNILDVLEKKANYPK